MDVQLYLALYMSIELKLQSVQVLLAQFIPERVNLGKSRGVCGLLELPDGG